jgi:hypothetical protein
LNLPGPGGDQEQASSRGGKLRGTKFHEKHRSDRTDPIAVAAPPPGMGTIMIRFVGLLVVAVVVLALAWSR